MQKIVFPGQQKKKLTLLLLAFFMFSFLFAQQKITVTGKVVAGNALPLEGVSVNVRGSTAGTATDAGGQFSIQLTKGATLVFTFVNYQSKQIVVNSESDVSAVTLVPTVSSLEEVVVVGYGTQSRRNVTGAIATVDVSKLQDISSANVTKLLVGQAPGVTVKQTTGSPGREFQVIIRGSGSLGAGSAPLYVIDGFPVGTSIGQNLNPDDIKSITILKDAVSTAIYGARGSNGVVLITTKTAKEGEVLLTASANYGIQNIPDSRKTKVLNGEEFAQFRKDAFMDKIRYFENREPSVDEVPLNFRYPEQTEYSTNWLDEILNQNSPFQNYNITLANGKGAIRSLVSAGLLNQEGSLINTGYKLYSLRANVGGQVNKFINMGINIDGSYATQRQARGTEGRDQIVGGSLIMDPREPVYNEDGSYNSYIGGHDGIFGFYNPVQVLNEAPRNYTNTNLVANGFLEISFLKHFKFKPTINAGLYGASYKYFVPSSISGINAPAPRNATEDDSYSTRLNISTDQLLSYSNDFGDHSVDVLAGYTAQEETSKGLSGNGNQFPDDLVPFLNAAIIKSSSSYENGWSMQAFFGRLNYSYKDRYLFSGTFRREGSSRFGSQNKWGNFPAFSAGWRISDESFMPELVWLNDLKIRGSWGITGNNNIGNYSSLSFMNPSNYVFNNNYASGRIVSSFANTELGWERSTQTDIGIDLTALDNQLTFSAEFCNRITTDMLLSIQLPAIAGFTSTLGNVGKVQNRGLEFSAGYRKKINAFTVWGNGNISFNKNKVLAIRGVNDEIWSGDFYSTYNVSKVGRPIGMLYGFRMMGIFQNQDEIDKWPKQDGAIPGVYKYYDDDGNGVISYDTKDMVEIGNPWPKFTWGFNLGANYKNFDLSILLTGAQGYDLFRNIEASTLNMDGVFNVLTVSKDRFRSQAQPGNGWVATTNTWKWERESNSRYVYDGSHAWVKNISLGYTIPKSVIRVTTFRLFLSADNLFLISNYPGNNPEIDSRGGISPGFDDEAYPVGRTFSIGANLTF
ncbi:MAG: TonB-dependent receptor [Chitinophagaceae bacterium]|nr:TonB-dependent receptor [Chitinophagaceae bacterium]